MKTKMITTIAIALTLTACGEKVNYDPDYVFEEAKSCNTKPYEKIYVLCKVELQDGVEPKRACKTKSRTLAMAFENLESNYLFGGKGKNECLLKILKHKK